MAQASREIVRRPEGVAQPGWWIQPTYTAVALGIFSLYSLWEVFFHVTGRYGNYLSPFFSPDVTAWGIHVVPALWVVWAPLLFRATCYYYRREYYRAFFFDPPACAVGEPKSRRNYRGETRFPFVLNNLHRFFFYLAVVVMIFLWIDAVEAFFFPHTGFGVGLGSLIMLANVVCLTVYTFSCHAWRHMIGGSLNCFSCGRNPRFRYGLWHFISGWNTEHGMWAWISMFTVWGADLYIRLLISGAFHDPRFF